jgi:hypothetical protein
MKDCLAASRMILVIDMYMRLIRVGGKVSLTCKVASREGIV